MQVLVRQAIEPGSYASKTQRVVLANNAISDRLRRIVRRYISGELTGRSFLISGHRGAGKTTLVRKVVQDVELEIEATTPATIGAPQQRPLLVVLPGPMLLPPGQTIGSGEAETSAVLQFITVNLYRALARSFSDRYEALAIRAGRAEMASAFRLKLDGYVSLAELRGFWSAIGALQTGIVSPHGQSPDDQGPREIAALWSCLRAYLSLSAEYQEAAGRMDGSEGKSEVSMKGGGDKGLLQALMAAAAGSAAGAGSVSAGKSYLFTAFATIGAAAASALLVSFSGSRSRSSSDSLESKVTLRRDLKTLTRELPELIMRCRDAGMVPVFLIDELDKVERLEQRMESLVRNTKFFVTEQALFFFVTDRAYYEYIETLSRDSAYPREHTFFSQRLFVVYQPEDWRRYILELLVAPAGPDGSFVAEALSFVLLCRSRMHAIDLRREIAKITQSVSSLTRDDIESEVTAEHVNVTQTRPQMEILMQVAVEVTYFEDPDLWGRCAGEPPFTQVVYDALYYPARQWTRDPATPFNLDRAQFESYLQERSKALSGEGDQEEINFLFRKVKGILNLLSDPPLLLEAMESDCLKGKIPDSIRACIRSVPALATRTVRGYEWRYDTYGRSMNPALLEDVLDDRELWGQVEMIQGISDKIAGISGPVVVLETIQKAGLMDLSPSVSDVSQSIRRLEAMRAQKSPVAYREMDTDVEDVRRFGKDLRARSASIARLVVAAVRLQAFSARPEPERLQAAFSAICDRLGRDMTADQMHGRVSQVFTALMKLSSWDSETAPLSGGDQFSFLAWEEWIEIAADAAKFVVSIESLRPGMEVVAWQAWQKRITGWLGAHPLGFDEKDEALREQLICAVKDWGPGSLLRMDIATVTSAAWSTIALSDETPVWARLVALIALGHEQSAANLQRAAQNAGTHDPGGELQRLIDERIAAQRLPRTGVVAVPWSLSGAPAQWIPNSGQSILVLTPDRWTQFAALPEKVNPYKFPDSLFYPAPAFLFLEYVPHESVRTLLPETHDGGPFRSARCGFIASESVTSHTAPGPMIVLPRSATEAIEKLSLLPPWNPFSPDPPSDAS